MKKQLNKEDVLFANYLEIDQLDETILLKYNQAIKTLHIEPTEAELSMIKLIIKQPWLLSYIDGGLALSNSTSNFRKRLLLLSALKETTPTYYTEYINTEPIKYALFKTILIGMRASIAGIIGIIIVKIYGWK